MTNRSCYGSTIRGGGHGCCKVRQNKSRIKLQLTLMGRASHRRHDSVWLILCLLCEAFFLVYCISPNDWNIPSHCTIQVWLVEGNVMTCKLLKSAVIIFLWIALKMSITFGVAWYLLLLSMTVMINSFI